MNPGVVSPSRIGVFQRRLLRWFAARKRDLPWRRTTDPYRIWLAEIMLQQTRVAAVVPYYERFLARFPDVRALAGARLESVLGNWAGLGYYSRARNLRRAAKKIVARHGGDFPRSYEAALALPGVGSYTAAAVLSIAYDEPLAVLDGNVARVLARLGAVRGDLRAPRLRRRLQDAAQGLLDRTVPGDWNQALMELGATVCLPKSPNCGECPVAGWCRARKLGIADRVPLARKKRSPVQMTLAAAVLVDPQGRTLLFRQTNDEGALFSRLWQFPAFETGGGVARRNFKRELKKRFGISANGRITLLRPARHTVTFREILLEPCLIRVRKLPELAGARTPFLERLGRLPISNATRKIARLAIGHLTGPSRG